MHDFFVKFAFYIGADGRDHNLHGSGTTTPVCNVLPSGCREQRRSYHTTALRTFYPARSEESVAVMSS